MIHNALKMACCLAGLVLLASDVAGETVNLDKGFADCHRAVENRP